MSGACPSPSHSVCMYRRVCARTCFILITASELSWLPGQLGCWGLVADSWGGTLSQGSEMEVLKHRSSSDVGGSLIESSLDLGVSDQTGMVRSGALGLDMTPERLKGEGTEEGQAGPLEVFHPGETPDEGGSSVVVAEALRCQVKITTRRSLHLRIANHTARDVYVRLVGHGGRIAEISAGLQTKTLDQSKTWQ